jgi:hypothetical protein
VKVVVIVPIHAVNEVSEKPPRELGKHVCRGYGHVHTSAQKTSVSLPFLDFPRHGEAAQVPDIDQLQLIRPLMRCDGIT